MNNSILSRALTALSLCAALSAASGCSLVHKIRDASRLRHEETELKKTRFQSLKNDLLTQDLVTRAVASETIKDRYGVPDDIFYSGSSVSSFQVWTYNISRNRLTDPDTAPIILYFNNDKLVNWKN